MKMMAQDAIDCTRLSTYTRPAVREIWPQLAQALMIRIHGMSRAYQRQGSNINLEKVSGAACESPGAPTETVHATCG
jgi:hypothetical protein